MIRDSAERTAVNWTLALVVVSWFAWTVFQTVTLVRDHNNLRKTRTAQEAPFQESVKSRAQVDSIMNGTSRLASQGNPAAQMIVTELQRRGITIDPNTKTIPPGSQ